jgi:hypothetical protein
LPSGRMVTLENVMVVLIRRFTEWAIVGKSGAVGTHLIPRRKRFMTKLNEMGPTMVLYLGGLTVYLP